MITDSRIIETPEKEPDVNEIIKLNNFITSNVAKIHTSDGMEIDIPIKVLQLMQDIIDTLAHGRSLTIIPMEKN